MNARVGFIGGGTMGEAFISAFVRNQVVLPGYVSVSDPNEGKLKYLNETYGVKTFSKNVDVVLNSDVVFLSVKPQVMTSVLTEISKVATTSQIFVSIAAGYPIERIEEILGDDKKIVRVMPNILVKVGEGVCAICNNHRLFDEDLNVIKDLLSSCSDVVSVNESQMDAVTGLSGSGPAFIFLVIEALADGGVRSGLSRDVALKLAAKVVKGSAVAVLEGNHPEVLKDKVTSPAGTTIEGLSVLEDKAVRSAFMDAVYAAFKRSAEISKLIEGM